MDKNNSDKHILSAAILIGVIIIPIMIFLYVRHSLIIDPLPIGSPVPSVVLYDMNGRKIIIDSLLSHKTILVFFSPKCRHCEHLLTFVEQTYQLSERQLSVFAITNSSFTMMREFIARNHLSIPVLSDTTGQIQKAYKVRTVPTTFFIDSNKMLADVRTGEIAEEILVPMLKKYQREQESQK